MIIFAAAAAAQMPSVPKVPTDVKPPAGIPGAPSVPGAGNVAAPAVKPPGGASIPDTSQMSNQIDEAKLDAECKIPTNATKPECVERMLKK
jgi:hypothetical protein